MSIDTDGRWGARCDFGFRSADAPWCGERATVEAPNQATFVRVLRGHGWRIARTTDDALIRYSRKPRGMAEAEWERSKPASIYSARCPEHAGVRDHD